MPVVIEKGNGKRRVIRMRRLTVREIEDFYTEVDRIRWDRAPKRAAPLEERCCVANSLMLNDLK